MAITLTEDGQFFNTAKGSTLSIFAKQTKAGRWQYRMGSHKGDLVAAGMSPAAFVKRFWMRDDFEA
jgi:hypothetical protein